MNMKRGEHLQWSKDRAIEYINKNDLEEAFASFQGDMAKHPQLADHLGLQMGTMLLISGHLSKPYQMEEWINGFN